MGWGIEVGHGVGHGAWERGMRAGHEGQSGMTVEYE